MKSKQDRYRDYARLGAQLRASELQQEINEIFKAFPELRKKGATAHPNGAQMSAAAGPARSAPASAPRRRRTPPKWSAAARKAVSQRMKKYWAERRRAG
jgi:hypothetical protein